MATNKKKVYKVRTTLAITKEARDTIYDFGYASARTQGEFISQLIVDHHAPVQLARGRHQLTHAEIAGELAKQAELLEADNSQGNAGIDCQIAAKLIRTAMDLLSL